MVDALVALTDGGITFRNNLKTELDVVHGDGYATAFDNDRIGSPQPERRIIIFFDCGRSLRLAQAKAAVGTRAAP